MDNKLTEYVLRHSKKHDEELKYDFMPSMLEIIERPAHKAGTVIITGIFTLLVAVVIWACLSETDIVITSQGNIQPVGNINVVESIVNGTVKSIGITEGQYVEAGDTLIELDSQNLEIEAEHLKRQAEIYRVQSEVYKLIKSGNTSENIDILKYDFYLRSYVQAILDSDISYRNNLIELENDKNNADINHQLAQIQLEEYYETGTSRQIRSQELVVTQRKNELDKVQISINDLTARYKAQINTQISEIDSKLQETRVSLEKYDFSKECYVLTAPVNGYVQSIGVNTVGEMVSADEKLVTIIPENTPVEMICYVKNMDIADIETGMSAEVKLEAYPYNKFGTVDAEVLYISPGSFSHEQLGNVYLVKLGLNNQNDDIKIFTGLSGVVEIKTGKRTIMEYFLEPITKGFGESLKEK